MSEEHPIRQLPDDITFEQWIDHVFDHPIMDPQWWFQVFESDEYEEWNTAADPARTVAYLTRLFNDPAFLMERFNRAQINQGLNYLVSNACSNHMFALRDKAVPWAERRACFEAMVPLYAKLMAPVYGDDLGYIQTGPGDPDRPTFSCHMWWDVIPIYGGMDDDDRDRINDVVLWVFERVLTLRSEACMESVLHGLGHWHLYLPARTEPIVRRFLERSDISTTLRIYAERAAIGRVQ